MGHSNDSRAVTARAVTAQGMLEFKLLLRSGESLLATLGIPIGALVFFSLLDVLPTGERDPVFFLVPGVLVISVMATAMVAQAIQTGFERKYGVLKRLGATPLTRGGLVMSKAAAVAAVLVFQVVLVVAIAAFGLGWEAPAGLGAATLSALVALAVGAVTFSAIGLAIAGLLRAEGTLAAVNALFLILLGVSGLAFESAELPGGVEVLGRSLPSGALADALRAALDLGTFDLAALLVVAAWGAAGVLIAVRTFRWDT